MAGQWRGGGEALMVSTVTEALSAAGVDLGQFI